MYKKIKHRNIIKYFDEAHWSNVYRIEVFGEEREEFKKLVSLLSPELRCVLDPKAKSFTSYIVEEYYDKERLCLFLQSVLFPKVEGFKKRLGRIFNADHFKTKNEIIK